MNYIKVTDQNYKEFHDLVDEYLRDGEDKDTAQEIIDSYIKDLLDLDQKNLMSIRLVKQDELNLGFVIWMKDLKENEDYSELPGYGTIGEIGLRKEYRGHGYGKEMVEYAETQLKKMDLLGLYVTAYGPAQGFWKKCGYQDTGKVGANGLPIYMK